MDRIRIKHRLLDKGLTLVDLAARAGLSYDRLVRIVNGYRPPRPDEVERVSRALGIPRERLYQQPDEGSGNEHQ